MRDIIAALDNISDVLEQRGVTNSALILDKVADTLEYLSDEVEFGVKEAAKKKKWIPKDLKKGALHRHFGIPEDEKIPADVINAEYKKLQKKAEGDKKLSESESVLFKRLQFAKNVKGIGK